MLEKIKDNLIELVLEAIRIDRRGDSAVPTTVVNGVIQYFAAVEDPKLRVPGDPSTRLTVSVTFVKVSKFISQCGQLIKNFMVVYAVLRKVL